MKVEKETTPTIAAQDERKKGSFLIRQDYLKTACHFLTNEALGAVFRNINDFVTDPQHVAQLDPLPNMCYYQLTEGIKQENEKYYKILARRQANYQDMKRRAASFGKNNSNKNDKNDETAETSENEKNDFSNRIGKGNALVYGKDKEGNATEGFAADRNATEGNGTEEVVNTTSDNSYKNFNSKNSIFFNKEYTRGYLLQKKLFLKKEAFNNFFDYNCEIMHWAYKPETAFRRWIKKNPEDEEKPKEEKKAPEQPRTPAALQELGERLHTLWRETFTVTDFKTWLTDFYLIEAKYTVDGYELTFSTVSKFKAEHIREHFEDKIRATFEGVKNCKVKIINYKFVYCSELCELQNIKIEPPKEAAKHFTEMPASLQNRFKGKTPPAVYVDETQTLN